MPFGSFLRNTSPYTPSNTDRGEPLPEALHANPPTHILAADCVYFEPAFPLLLQTLSDIFSACPKAVVYFCFKKRRNADKQFMKNAKKLFDIQEIEDKDKAIWSREQLFMYEFRKKEGKNGAKKA